MSAEPRLGLAGRLARPFLRSKLTPVIVLASILLGLVAVALTPREEEPQIVVPMVDVIVPMPGATPSRGGDARSSTPLERRLWGIPGVEYLYSTSRPSAAFITVRFKVNEPLEPSLVKVHQELAAHPELLPPGGAAARRAGAHHRRRPVPHGDAARGRGAARRRAAQARRRGRPGDRRRPAHRATCACSAARGASVRDRAGSRRGCAPCRSRSASCTQALAGRAGAAPRRRARGGRARASRSRRAGFARSAARAAARRRRGARRPAPLRRGRRAGDGRARARAGGGPHRARRSGPASSRPPRIVVAKRPGTNATELAETRARQGRGAARPASSRPPSTRRSPATTARPRARSRTSSSSTSSSRRSPSSRSSSSPWAGAPRWWWRSPSR